MIRRVAFSKALLAGGLGALVWEACFRVLIGFGLPLFDVTYSLGKVVVPDAVPAVWWPIGLFFHMAIGGVWALFYAYFIWSEIRQHPAIQGLLFSLLPAVLAGLIMVPQMGNMDLRVLAGEDRFPGLFAIGQGWGGPVGIVLGHLIFGAVMGAIYVRPVGAPVAREARHA